MSDLNASHQVNEVQVKVHTDCGWRVDRCNDGTWYCPRCGHAYFPGSTEMVNISDSENHRHGYES